MERITGKRQLREHYADFLVAYSPNQPLRETGRRLMISSERVRQIRDKLLAAGILTERRARCIECNKRFSTTSSVQVHCPAHIGATEHRSGRICARTGCANPVVSSSGRARYCSATCREAAYRERLQQVMRQRARVERPARDCEYCGGEIKGRRGSARYCSDRCRIAGWREKGRK